jgi:hypothetical protein
VSSKSSNLFIGIEYIYDDDRQWTWYVIIIAFSMLSTAFRLTFTPNTLKMRWNSEIGLALLVRLHYDISAPRFVGANDSMARTIFRRGYVTKAFVRKQMANKEATDQSV